MQGKFRAVRPLRIHARFVAVLRRREPKITGPLVGHHGKRRSCDVNVAMNDLTRPLVLAIQVAFLEPGDG